MIKRRIVETVEEYGKNGLIVKRTRTETTEDDDEKVKYKLENTSTPMLPCKERGVTYE